MTKEFQYIILPCPGDPHFHDKEISLSDLDNGLYLGAEDRMRAAVLKAKSAEKVVLIGGSQSKVVSMFLYFKQKMCEFNHDKTELICLVSKPDSTGNLSAFRKYFEQKNNGKNIRDFNIAIISNQYHLERLTLIWNSIFETSDNPNLKLISTSKILNDTKTENRYVTELKLRKEKEKAGCMDWKNKCYKNQCEIIKWNPTFWTCEELILNFETKIY